MDGRKRSTVVSTPATSQNSDVESFQCKITPLNSSTLDKLRHILDHRCIVGGGEQIFLLALGVSLKTRSLARIRIQAQRAARQPASPCALSCVEVPDIYMGCQNACALEETGGFQARAAERDAAECGDRPRAEGRGETLPSQSVMLGMRQFSVATCLLAAKLLLYNYKCCVFIPQGKAQRRIGAVHVMDALILNGTDVRDQHFNQR